jgi:hypothetical protein
MKRPTSCQDVSSVQEGNTSGDLGPRVELGEDDWITEVSLAKVAKYVSWN